MEATQVLKADILDILFERMNKDYGAYQLRKGYNKRLKKALSITALAALLLIGGMELSQIYARYQERHQFVITETKLTNVVDIKPATPPPVIPPLKVVPPRIEIVRFTPPVIVDRPQEDRIVKKQDDLDDVTIGLTDQKGIKEPDVVNPPKVDQDSKVVSGPAPYTAEVIFMKVEIEAEFPGGDAKWNDYVRRTMLAHMDELQDEGKSGTCEVQFIVDRTGVVSDVEALTMQGTKLAEIAVNAIRRGPNWYPAQQNGRMVKAFRRQKITFQMPEE
jgi:protein TonB